MCIKTGGRTRTTTQCLSPDSSKKHNCCYIMTTPTPNKGAEGRGRGHNEVQKVKANNREDEKARGGHDWVMKKRRGKEGKQSSMGYIPILCGRHTAKQCTSLLVTGWWECHLFYNTPAHTILIPSSLWISIKALPPPTILALTQCTRHMCTFLLLLQGIHIIFKMYVSFLYLSHPSIVPASLGVLSHLQWNTFISACHSSSIGWKGKL